jgi:hypothetical protein
MREPGLALVKILLGFAKIDDAAVPEACLGADLQVHGRPHAEALNAERDFGGVPAHRSTPTPIPTRLLAGDASLFA